MSDFEEKPSGSNPYVRGAIVAVNGHSPDLWDHLDRVPQLDPQTGRKVLRLFLVLACQCQNVSNIRIGRWGVAAIPRAWVLANVEAEAEPMLRIGDPWEWLRLMEVYQSLDRGLLEKLLDR